MFDIKIPLKISLLNQMMLSWGIKSWETSKRVIGASILGENVKDSSEQDDEILVIHCSI